MTMQPAPSPALAPADIRRLRDKVIDLWGDGFDTDQIARQVGYAEAWVDREISKHLSRQVAAGKKRKGA
jgi:hypothetical protein